MIHDFKTAQPIEFYKHFLKENIRPDGREHLDFRSTLLNIGSINTGYGSSLVRLGNTTVICGITAQLAKPTVEHPNEGFFVPNVELPASCSPNYRPGPPSDEAQCLSQFVAETVKNSRMLDLTDLCIAEKKMCWVIYADIHCVSHDGNVKDAAIVSLNGALRNAQLPMFKYNEDTDSMESMGDQMFQLKLKNMPISTTFSIFNESILLADPTHEEQEISSGTFTVVVGDEKTLCSVYKPGGCSIKVDLLKNGIQVALNRYNELKSLVNTTDEVSPGR